MLTHVTFVRRSALPGTVAPATRTQYFESKAEALAEARLVDSMGLAQSWTGVKIESNRAIYLRCCVFHRCAGQGEGSMMWDSTASEVGRFRWAGAQFTNREF